MSKGLFPPQRQCRLLRGLAKRCSEGVKDWERLGTQHYEQLDALIERQRTDKQQLKARSELQLRQFLQEWDSADETATAAYEQQVLQTRVELNRMSVEFRRRHRHGVGEIERFHQESKGNANKAYETQKVLPGKQKARENSRLNQGWNAINERLEAGREIALKRLQGLDNPPEMSDSYQAPSSVDEAVLMLNKFAEACDGNLAKLNDDFSVRFLESPYLLLTMFASFVLWCLGVLLAGMTPALLWIAGGILVPLLVGGVCLAIFSPKMKRLTREWYPGIEQHAVDAVAIVKDGQERASDAAAALAKKIKEDHTNALRIAEETRVQQLQALERDLKLEQEQREASLRKQLADLEKQYNNSFLNLESSRGDEFAHVSEIHKEQMNQAGANRTKARTHLASRQKSEDQLVAHRIREGLTRALGRIDQACAMLSETYPDWEVVADGKLGTTDALRIIPIGYLDVADYLRRSVQNAADRSKATDDKTKNRSSIAAQNDYIRSALAIEDTLPKELPDRLPVALTSPQHSGLLIDCPGGSSEKVVELVRAVLWRLLSALPPGNLNLTLLDPIGRGQTFASLMALADHDPTLVGHRAWTQPNQIETRLAELTQHMEDVLQTYLRDNFATIDQYNAQAGSMAEPYRVVAAMGVPSGLTSAGYEHLRALMENGRRCGIVTVIVRDPEESWPHDFSGLPMDQLLHLKVNAEGELEHTDSLLSKLPFRSIEPPKSALVNKLTDEVGQGAIRSRRVEIPFDDVMPPSQYNDGDSADGLDIPLGQQGAGRQLRLQLGEGVKQHMLVAGKTGSGKSTLLHTIITAGALKYSPDELHLYLLDFKKGVEFKTYADGNLPHARVIGIESEREFGQSVLERLDRELQHRGELFRAAGVQEVGEYRRKTGEKMPRIMLVVDEFQEMFVRDDRIAQDCTMLFDRLVRQGRSFGMHVILSSQSLAGAYSLPRNTMGQMAVRVALQCSESDALVILAEDNTAARLLSRPGEAIYNDAGGLIEGNQPFQVGWLDHGRHHELLVNIADRYPDAQTEYGPPVIFEGNRPAKWSSEAAEAAFQSIQQAKKGLEGGFGGLLGEAVAIGPPVTLNLQAQPGRNVLVVCSDNDLTRDVLGVTIPALYGGALANKQKLRVIMLDGRRVAPEEVEPAGYVSRSGIPVEMIKPRDAEAKLLEIAALVEERSKLDAPEQEPPVLVVVDPIERFRDLRQDDSSFSFSLDASPKQSASAALQAILRDGSAAAIHVILCCGGAETVSRWLPRQSQHDLELTILGQMSMTDSSQLIDNPEASRLSPASMMIYDDSSGRLEKFRVIDLPPADKMQTWIESHLE